MTAQLELFLDPAPQPTRYPTYWERMGRLPEVGDYVTPVGITLRGADNLRINGQPYGGHPLYLFGECVRVTERLADDLWAGVVDMGYVFGNWWDKNDWQVQFRSDEVTLSNRRPNPSDDPGANWVNA